MSIERQPLPPGRDRRRAAEFRCSSRLAALAVLLLAAGASLPPETARGEEQVEVRLLEVSFSAQDGRGRPVPGLEAREVFFRFGRHRLAAEYVESAAPGSSIQPASGAAGRMSIGVPAGIDAAATGAEGALAIVIDAGRWPVLRRPAFAAALARLAERAAAGGERVAVFSLAGGLRQEAPFTIDPRRARRAVEGALAAPGAISSLPGRRVDELVTRLESCVNRSDYLRQRVETDPGCVREAAEAYAEETKTDRSRWVEGLEEAVSASASVIGPATLVVAGHPPALDPDLELREALLALAGDEGESAALLGVGLDGHRGERGLEQLRRQAEARRLRLVFVDPAASPAGRGGARGRRLLAPGRDPRRRAFDAAIDGLRRLAEPTGGRVFSGRSPEELLGQFENWRAGLYRAGVTLPRDVTRGEIDRLRLDCARRGVRLRQARALRPTASREPDPSSARLALARSVALEEGAPGRAVEFALLAEPALLPSAGKSPPSCHLRLSTAGGAAIADAYLPRVEPEAPSRNGSPPRWVAGRLELPPGRYRLQARLSAGGRTIDLQRLIEVSTTTRPADPASKADSGLSPPPSPRP